MSGLGDGLAGPRAGPGTAGVEDEMGVGSNTAETADPRLGLKLDRGVQVAEVARREVCLAPRVQVALVETHGLRKFAVRNTLVLR